MGAWPNATRAAHRCAQTESIMHMPREDAKSCHIHDARCDTSVGTRHGTSVPSYPDAFTIDVAATPVCFNAGPVTIHLWQTGRMWERIPHPDMLTGRDYRNTKYDLAHPATARRKERHTKTFSMTLRAVKKPTACLDRMNFPRGANTVCRSVKVLQHFLRKPSVPRFPHLHIHLGHVSCTVQIPRRPQLRTET